MRTSRCAQDETTKGHIMNWNETKVNVSSAIAIGGVLLSLPLLPLSPSSHTDSPPAIVQTDDSVTIYINSLPPCEMEDSPGPCYWDASRGNGNGHSFVSLPTP